jgi:adenosylcobinamide-GDP ribazoletransferase
VRPDRRPWHGAAGALALLTIVPVGGLAGAGLEGAAPWFPLVGAAVGALAGVVRLACGPPLGSTVASVLALMVLVILTGALHQDGLADTADGLGARAARARRLEAMRDSATGVFGVLALTLWALLLVTTLGSLSGQHALRALIVAGALSRWALVLHAAWAPPARPDGLGASFRVSPGALALATVPAVAAALALGGLAPGATVLGAVALLALLAAAFVRRTLGGRTGDTLGATAAIAEALVCVVLLAFWQG